MRLLLTGQPVEAPAVPPLIVGAIELRAQLLDAADKLGRRLRSRKSCDDRSPSEWACCTQ